jgi:hypothetical protein
VENELGVAAGIVNGAVDYQCGWVDYSVTLHDLTVSVDDQQIGRRDFSVEQAEASHEIVLVTPG